MKSLKNIFIMFIHFVVPSTIIATEINFHKTRCEKFIIELIDRFNCTEICEEMKNKPIDFKYNDTDRLHILTKPSTPTSETKPKQNESQAKAEAEAFTSKRISDSNAVLVPKYAVYLIGFIMLILTVLTITFGILLYRSKLHDYKVFGSPETPSNTINVDATRRYLKQSSQDMSLLTINSKQECDDKDTHTGKTKYQDEPNSISGTTKIASPQKHLKIYKSVQKPVDHQMLLREQMKKICEDALAKSQNSGLTASLKDLNKLLNEFDNEKREKTHENIAREKSASYPQLDIYDEPPARKPDVPDFENDIPVYDSVPTTKNVVINDIESNYLLTLSQENDSEPSYINARCLYR